MLEPTQQIEQAFDDFDRANDLAKGSTAEVVLNMPENVEKMKNFLIKNGIVCKRKLSPKELSALIYTQYRKWASEYKNKEKASFLGDEQAFDSFENTDVYKYGENAYIKAREKEIGFEGFDNFAYGAIAKAGLKGIKKIREKVKEAQAKKRAKQASESAEKQASAVNIAVPQSALTAEPQGKAIDQIKYELAKVAEQYKENEKNKYIREKTPMIILFVALILLVGFMVGKLSSR